MKSKKVIVTHRGTVKSIKKKKRKMILRANYPIPNNRLTRRLEDRNKVVWVSKGEPNLWNKIWSGMIGKRDEACIIFEIEASRLRKPNGICKWIFGTWIFGYAQLVIDEDVEIPNDAIFMFKGCK